MVKTKFNLWILTTIFILIIFLQQPKEEKKMAGCTTANCVDFESTSGVINMYYGANEDNDWQDFATTPMLQQYHKDVTSSYIRTWLAAIWYRPSTFPLKSDGSYTWTNVDLFVDAVLAIGAKPMIVFAHGDKCGSPGDASVAPFNFNSCEGHGTVPPSNFNNYANYTAAVTQHFADRYGIDEVNTWYFEIMNEPYNINLWNNFQDYYTLFNLAQSRIKAIVPNAKVGGYAYNGVSDALSKSNYAFIDLHLYPGNVYSPVSSDQDRMNAIPSIYNKILDVKNQAGSVEIISGEYNIDTDNPAYSNSQRPFVGSWIIATLINKIKAGATMELIYMGTCSYPGNSGCMGLWHIDGTTFDSYRKKKIFTNINPRGATIYSNVDDNNYDILATKNGDKKYITIVRKQENSGTLNLQLLNINTNSLINVGTSEQYIVSGNTASLSFSAFETKFLEVKELQVYNYQSFITTKNNYINGGSFSDFVTAANQWVQSA